MYEGVGFAEAVRAGGKGPSRRAFSEGVKSLDADIAS